MLLFQPLRPGLNGFSLDDGRGGPNFGEEYLALDPRVAAGHEVIEFEEEIGVKVAKVPEIDAQRGVFCHQELDEVHCESHSRGDCSG